MLPRDSFVPPLELKLKSLQLAFDAVLQKFWDREGVFSTRSHIQPSLRKKTRPQFGNGFWAGNTA
jgi:hypothetical protein